MAISLIIAACFLIVLWVMAIISASYSVVVLLSDSLGKLYPTVDTNVAYGSGFYLIAGTGKKTECHNVGFLKSYYRWCGIVKYILHVNISAKSDRAIFE